MKPLILNMAQTSALFGSGAALMLFAQGGACMGRAFKLFAGGRTISITMTADGCRVDSPLSAAQLRDVERAAQEDVDDDAD